MPRSDRIARTVHALSLVALLAWIGIDLLGKPVFGDRPWPDGVIDFRLIYDYSRQVLETHRYPPIYPHPPSAVLLQALATQTEFAIAAAIWITLTAGMTVALYATLLAMLRREQRPSAWWIALAAHGIATYFLQWEFRSLNCNLMFLGALVFAASAVQRNRPHLAGFWLAVGISLKLYPILVVPYLFWTRRRSAGFSAVAWLGVFWMVLPAAVFGRDLGLVYSDWFAQITRAADPLNHSPHPILISINTAADWLAQGDARWATAIVWSVRTLWLAAIAGVMIAARRSRDCHDVRVLLSDIALLTLAPIAVSPYLEPYHAVPFVIPAIVLVSTAADASVDRRQRAISGVVALLSAAMVPALVPWSGRGLLVCGKLFVGAVGAAAVSRANRASQRRSPAIFTRRAA